MAIFISKTTDDFIPVFSKILLKHLCNKVTSITGYYRVNYDPDLWDNLIDALEDPERREEIHPLNRAAVRSCDTLSIRFSSVVSYLILATHLKVSFSILKMLFVITMSS